MTTHHDGRGWRTAAKSADSANCVEVGRCACGVLVRDSKDRGAGAQAARPETWAAFLSDVRAGRLDLPA